MGISFPSISVISAPLPGESSSVGDSGSEERAMTQSSSNPGELTTRRSAGDIAAGVRPVTLDGLLWQPERICRARSTNTRSAGGRTEVVGFDLFFMRRPFYEAGL